MEYFLSIFRILLVSVRLSYTFPDCAKVKEESRENSVKNRSADRFFILANCINVIVFLKIMHWPV